MIGTLLYVIGTRERHFKLKKEEMNIPLNPIQKEDTQTKPTWHIEGNTAEFTWSGSKGGALPHATQLYWSRPTDL